MKARDRVKAGVRVKVRVRARGAVARQVEEDAFRGILAKGVSKLLP